jgi:hypothetical protein
MAIARITDPIADDASDRPITIAHNTSHAIVNLLSEK